MTVPHWGKVMSDDAAERAKAIMGLLAQRNLYVGGGAEVEIAIADTIRAAELAERGQWSRELPTAPGYYWYRATDQGLVIADVFWSHLGDLCVMLNRRHGTPAFGAGLLSSFPGEWCRLRRPPDAAITYGDLMAMWERLPTDQRERLLRPAPQAGMTEAQSTARADDLAAQLYARATLRPLSPPPG